MTLIHHDERWTRHVFDCRWCGRHHYTVQRGWSPKACLVALLDRCEELEYELRRVREGRAQDRRDVTELSDLRLVVRDQQNHIKNLEAQLRPYLVNEDPPQEAML